MIEILSDFPDARQAAEWEQYIISHPASGPYHRLVWPEVFQRIFHYRCWRVIARRAGAIVGAMTLYRIPTLSGAMLVTVPFRDRGDVLHDDEEVLAALLQHAIGLTRAQRCRSLLLKSASLPPMHAGDAKSFSVKNDWIRSYVTLPANMQEYWKELDPQVRNKIRQGERFGLEFIAPLGDDAERDKAMAVLRDTQRRLGIPPFPREFYRCLSQALEQQGAGLMCGVRHSGRLLAATLLLHHRDTVVYAYAGSLREAWRLRVNDFLIWNCLRYASSVGARVFEFGSDSKHQADLLSFKKKWLAEQTPMHLLCHAPGGGKRGIEWRDSSAGVYPLVRKVVSRLPRPVYNLTGLLTRYLG